MCCSSGEVWQCERRVEAVQAGSAHAGLTSIPSMGKAGIVLLDSLMVPEHSKHVFSS